MKQWLLVGLGVVFLSGCMSGGVSLTDEGERYFDDRQVVSYYLGDVRLVSKNEEKSLKAGFKNSREVQEYMAKQLVGPVIRQSKADSADSVRVVVDLAYERIFSWGVSDSLASIQYEGTITLEHDGVALGRYHVSGNAQDASIAGDFKTMFAANESKDDSEYFNVIAQSIVKALPQS